MAIGGGRIGPSESPCCPLLDAFALRHELGKTDRPGANLIVTEAANLFTNVPNNLPEELVEVLAENQYVRIERIVSTGHASPEGFWYDQREHEWVVVLKGEAKLRFENDESVQMKAGDHLLIPPHRKHRVEWTTPYEPTVWLAVFYD